MVRHELPLHRPRARPRHRVLASSARSRSTSTPRRCRSSGSTRCPCWIGPVSFLLLGKPADGVDEDFDRLACSSRCSRSTARCSSASPSRARRGCSSTSPLRRGPLERELDALRLAYEELAKVQERPRILVKTYFDHVGDAYGVLRDLPVEGVGLDLHRGRHNVELIADQGGLEKKTLFAGIVDGRNVWINDLERSLDLLEGLRERVGELVVSTSCSLLHTPIDLDAPRARSRRRAALVDGLRRSRRSARSRRWRAGSARAARRSPPSSMPTTARSRPARLHAHPATPTCARVEALDDADARRESEFESAATRPAARASTCRCSPRRRSAPTRRPPRSARRARPCARARSTRLEYEGRMKSEIERVIRFQEEVGLDVLVHGEPERNDMVQYFAEQMEGYVFTQNAWVQSYGSRYVRPPIIFGDVRRPSPMTGRLDHLRPVAHRAAREGDAHRAR